MRLQMRRFASYLLLFIILGSFVAAQEGIPPLPQDTGQAGLIQAIRHLRNTARLLHTTAHPDDEDGGMLTLMSRGEGVHVMLLTLTRGEGGQNRTGSGLFDELGSLRTLELLAADRYYDADQRFTRVADFGFSKSAAETFEKWHGHDIPLGDMVRVIRTFRPDVIVSRFQGTERDGHGHHQAAGILSREAFRAAADPSRFPEQIQDGLLPWQAKKLYIDNLREGEDYSVILETTQPAPVLGSNYQAFAMQGLKHQLSQGAGQWGQFGGKHFSRYKLVDSVLPNTADAEGHERDFFDGIDTSIRGLAKRLGAEARKTPNIASELDQLQSKFESAQSAAEEDPRSAAKPLAEAVELLEAIREEVSRGGINRVTREDLFSHLPRREQIDHAIALAEGVTVVARLEGEPRPYGQIIVPGQKFRVSVTLQGPQGAKLTNASILAPAGWGVKELETDNSKLTERRFEVEVPENAEYTRPYYHRDNSVIDTVYQIDEPQFLTLPMAPRPVHAEAEYELDGARARISDVVEADSVFQEGTRPVPLAVAPPVSVRFEHATRVLRVGERSPVEVLVRVRSNVEELPQGTLSLLPATGWRVEPSGQLVEIKGKGSERTFKFYMFPEASSEMRFDIRAKLTIGAKDYMEGFAAVTRADLGTASYYRPAAQQVSLVDVDVPDNYVVGYIMGAGDEIPTVLSQVGVNVKMISPNELANGNLNARYNAILLGIRAYDVNEDVKKYNSRLLEFVYRGGTLLVQYNASVADFNSGHYTPYPAEIGRGRVSDETAPVEFLEPKDLVFNDPNDITPRDFEGWVQERGLNFMQSWGGKFAPLLQSHDPGERPLDGGLVRAWYGKGTYIYTGYSFFRQLPYGVPGAVRLFVNLLSAHQ